MQVGIYKVLAYYSKALTFLFNKHNSEISAISYAPQWVFSKLSRFSCNWAWIWVEQLFPYRARAPAGRLSQSRALSFTCTCLRAPFLNHSTVTALQLGPPPFPASWGLAQPGNAAAMGSREAGTWAPPKPPAQGAPGYSTNSSWMEHTALLNHHPRAKRRPL